MKAFWDKRYEEFELVYGLKPNEYFKSQLPKTTGKILLPGDGQGRNALFAAIQGWEVTAFDYSPVAKEQADQLFAQHNVEVDFKILSYQDSDFEKESFDCIVLIYNHMPSDFRKEVHQKYISFLKPNGILIIEGFSKKQFGLNSGGPKNIDWLFSSEMIQDDFNSLKTIQLIETQTILDEGDFHQGKAEVIRYTGQKT